jgi:hypothetical protein
MVEGLWSAEFFIPPSGTAVFGSGVVVLNQGKILGGDSTYYYHGDYVIAGGQFIAHVETKHYSGPNNNIFGEGIKFNVVKLSGPVDSNEMELQGMSPALGQNIAIRLERLIGL